MNIQAKVLSCLLLMGGAVWGGSICRCLRADETRDASASPVRVDRLGDPLPEGAVARLGTARFRAIIGSYLAFSPDGKLLASGEGGMGGGGTGAIFLWDVATGKKVRELLRHPGGGWLAFSADGKRLYSAGYDLDVRTWDVATGRELRQFAATGANRRYAFSPDAATLACACEDQVVRLWDLETGREKGTLRGHQGPHRVAFSPDGKRLVSSGQDKTIRFWKLDTGEEVGKIDGTRESVGELLNVPGAVDKLLWLPGDLLVTATVVGDLRLWEAPTGKPVGLLGSHLEPHLGGGTGAHSEGGSVLDLSGSPDGRFLVTTSGVRRNAALWDVKERRLLRAFGPEWGAMRASFAPDGKTVAVGGNHAITLIDAVTGRVHQQGNGPRGRFLKARFSADGSSLVTSDTDPALRIWETKGWTEVRQIPHRGGPVTALGVSADGKRIAGTVGLVPLIWDSATGKSGPKHYVNVKRRVHRVPSLALSPDGTLLASNGAIWDVATGKELGSLPRAADMPPMGEDMVPAVYAFAPDGRSLAVGHNQTVWVCDPKNGRPIRTIGRLEGTVVNLAWTADSSKLLTHERFMFAPDTGLPPLRLWEVATGRELRRQFESARMLGPIALSPDGRVVASMTVQGPVVGAGVPLGGARLMNVGGEVRATVVLHEVATGQPRRKFEGGGRDFTELTFSPDGRWLVSAGSSDSTALVWDVAGPRGEQAKAALGKSALELLWIDLGRADADRAYRAICTLAARPDQVVPFLRDRLKVAGPVDSARIDQLIEDLDSNQFSTREKAEAALAKIGQAAVLALGKVLSGDVSPEVRRRAERLLARQAGPVTEPSHLREMRAVEALERADGSEARRLLTSLAQGAPEALLTQEAKASLQRLAGQAGSRS